MLATPLDLGTTGQVVGLVTYQLSYPVVIVRSRLLTIGRDYEEAAIDLGASPGGALRRVLLKMLLPAIFASTVLVFADVIDDFVIVRYLSGDASTEPVSVKVYNTARAAPTPALNALTTLLLLASLLAVVGGYLAYRAFTRGEKESSDSTSLPARRSLERPFNERREPMLVTGFVPPAPVDAAQNARAQAPFGSSRMLPRGAYLDDAVLAWEREHVFGGWLCVGRGSDIPPARDERRVRRRVRRPAHAGQAGRAARLRERLPAPRPRAAALRRRRRRSGPSSARTTPGATGWTAA